MKKLIALLLAVLMVLGMAACASTPKEDTPAEKPAENNNQTEEPAQDAEQTAEPEGKKFEGKTLTMMMSMSESNATDAYYAQIAAFEEKYGCKVDVEAIQHGDEGENLKLVRLATGTLADIYQSSVGAKFDEFSPTENCVDISGEAWANNISDGYRSVVTYDGGVYATPADTSNAAGVIYNTKVFADLGIEIPETWDEFLTVCETIKAAGITPIAAPYAKQTNSQIPFLMNYYYVAQENPDFAEQYTNREIDLDSSAAFVRGLQKLNDMAQYINEDALSTGMDECAMMLGDGTAAMMVIRTNILVTMAADCPDKIADMDFFPLPDVDANSRGVSYWLPMGWVINKNAAEPELAKAWCEFVTSQEGVDAYSAAVAPTGTFCLNEVDLSGVEMPQALITAQEWVSTSSTPVMEYFCRIKGSNQATICSMCATGEITAEDACQQIMADNVVDAQQKGFVGW